ncbi:uncharacterized protein LOC141833794 [Curcuma longa]|uniref:uncharacterized protein LOC141833794 n=1 Tax=Curcuma longa TaxID=136217 RepID=UPI003D9F0CA4
MGTANSKIEEDKALVLCRERKRFVRQTLVERRSLADAHVSYVQSLRNVGMAFRKFVDSEASVDSSWNVSASSTTEPLAITDRHMHITNSSPSISQRMQRTESFSPVPSPHSSGRFHVNQMKAGITSYVTVEENPPTSVIATLETSSSTPKHITSKSDEISSIEVLPTTLDAKRWDYFDTPQLPSQNRRVLNHCFDDADGSKSFTNEGIPKLGDKDTASVGEDNELPSEDDFDQQSNEPLVQMFRNRNLILEQELGRNATNIRSIKDTIPEKEYLSGDAFKVPDENSGYNVPTETTSMEVALPLNGKPKESRPETNHAVRDLLSCVKEIEELFLKASESGTEVPRMLEANKVQFPPFFPERKAHRTKASTFVATFFVCCTDETPHPQDSDLSEVKYLTWHSSVPSLSSSSGNFLDPTMANDFANDLNSEFFSSTCMTSGSHASTLDRLYAWERKLCDEVKASGKIRREYDMKCRLLRHKESVGEKSIIIDKTRAIVKDLHSRIRVAIHRIDSISKQIEEIRDKELQPQLEELIEGLTRMWRMMLDYHTRQHSIISLVSSNDSTKVHTQSKSEQQAAVLVFELKSLCSNFSGWISAHKSYLQAVNGWLHKCVLSQKQNRSSRRKQQPFCPKRDVAPPIFVTCQDWLALLDKLPTEKVVSAINHLVSVASDFLPQDKSHQTSRLSLSVSRIAETSGGQYVPLSESNVNWNLQYSNLLLAFMDFLDKLKSFADSSVLEYEALKKSIDVARDVYEKTEFRK